MKPERIDEMRLTAADEAAIADLLARCFDTDFGGRTAFHQRHHVRLVLRDPGIVGHMALVFRYIRQGDSVIDVAGLAEVATDPARRGEGIARRLLDAAIAESRESLAQFLLLFGDAALYGAAGFVRVPNSIRYVDMTGAATGRVRTEVAESLMVLPLRDRAWDRVTPVDMLGHLF